MITDLRQCRSIDRIYEMSYSSPNSPSWSISMLFKCRNANNMHHSWGTHLHLYPVDMISNQQNRAMLNLHDEKTKLQNYQRCQSQSNLFEWEVCDTTSFSLEFFLFGYQANQVNQTNALNYDNNKYNLLHFYKTSSLSFCPLQHLDIMHCLNYCSAILGIYLRHDLIFFPHQYPRNVWKLYLLRILTL